MTFYFIDQEYDVNISIILNIMIQLAKDIYNSICQIFNIVIEDKYNLMIININKVLNNYLKIYYFYILVLLIYIYGDI